MTSPTWRPASFGLLTVWFGNLVDGGEGVNFDAQGGVVLLLLMLLLLGGKGGSVNWWGRWTVVWGLTSAT
jgi:hypothetical protein